MIMIITFFLIKFVINIYILYNYLLIRYIANFKITYVRFRLSEESGCRKGKEVPK